MTKAHAGSTMGLQGDFILPVNFEDKLFSYYWHTSSRYIHPTIDVSTIVPDDKWGYVLAVEDGTTNVISQSDLSNLHGWNPTDSANSYATQTSDGFWRVPRTNATTGKQNVEILMDRIYPVSEGQTWTESFYFRHDGTSIGFTVSFLTNNGHHPVPATIVKVGPNLYRAYATYTIETGGTLLRAIDINDLTGNWTYIDIKDAQLEQKAWATSFVNGTRDVGRIQYPKEIFPTGDFTLNMWLAHTGDTRTANIALKIFALDQDITKSRLTLWNYCPISADPCRIIADFGNNDVGTRQYRDLIHTTLFVPHQWEMITVTLDYASKTFKFYRNGVLWTAHTPSVLNGINAVELYNSGWKYSNLLICPRVVPDYEIRAWYEYGKPFYDAYDYTAVYG